MKIEKFLYWIQSKMINYSDISIETLKVFIDKFYEYLSEKEKKKYGISIQIINHFIELKIK